MIYVINCTCCGIRFSEKAPKGNVKKSLFYTFLRDMAEGKSAWMEFDMDREGLSVFFTHLLKSETALKSLGVMDKHLPQFEILHAALADDFIEDVLKEAEIDWRKQQQ